MKACLLGLAALLLVANGLRAEICVESGDKLAFLGDSITQFGNYPAGYINLVMRGLSHCGVEAVKIPAGISGHKSNNMLARVDRDVLVKKPRWMTLSCGVNDVWHGANGVPLETYKTNITAILDKCAASNVTVVVLTATMIGEDAGNENNRKLDAYNDWLRAEAQRRGLRLADLAVEMREELGRLMKPGDKPGHPSRLTTDGVHMAFRGNEMMAWGVLKALGVPADKKDEIYELWNHVRGFATAQLPVSKVEFDHLSAQPAGFDDALQLRYGASIDVEMASVPRESIEWQDTWIEAGDCTDRKLPRVLLLGDSISRQYRKGVSRSLQGKARVANSAGSHCVGDPMLNLANEVVLGAYEFDVIVVNNGLHGFACSEADYAANLKKYIAFLRRLAPKAKFIWARTTPIAKCGELGMMAERNARVKARNAAADAIMNAEQIPLLDLYGVIDGKGAEYFNADGVHYNEKGVEALVQAVTAAVLEQLPAAK